LKAFGPLFILAEPRLEAQESTFMSETGRSSLTSSIRKFLLRLLQQTVNSLGMLVGDLLHLTIVRCEKIAEDKQVSKFREERRGPGKKGTRERKKPPYLIDTFRFGQTLHAGCTSGSDVVLGLLGLLQELLEKGSSIGSRWPKSSGQYGRSRKRLAQLIGTLYSVSQACYRCLQAQGWIERLTEGC
jgi:hypothetical protein